MVLCREEYAKEIDSAVFPGIQGGPLMHIIAAKAVAFKEALTPELQRVPAADRRQRRSASPRASSTGASASSRGGTDNHLMLVDVARRASPARSPRRLSKQAGITVNKNTIPYERQRR